MKVPAETRIKSYTTKFIKKALRRVFRIIKPHLFDLLHEFNPSNSYCDHTMVYFSI